MRYRACSLCIIKRRESILLEQFPEEDGIITFRPVGGTIEYGEDSKSAVIREVKEEINIDIIEPKIDRDYRAHLPLVRRNWT
ncbi:NUDIX domain-containing protein [Paenibacillus odorifer]|uniref:NUDIX domain-containing protein n=1 Tax=Paenibacillus odorifer TaxID=189426 RepID=UPI00096EAB1B|nr:NUDIX domain-containing protein [Paenibacillus odorifer]